MAKLPKKSTMKETIVRVRGYAAKLQIANKITAKQYIALDNQLRKLESIIDE